MATSSRYNGFGRAWCGCWILWYLRSLPRVLVPSLGSEDRNQRYNNNKMDFSCQWTNEFELTNLVILNLLDEFPFLGYLPIETFDGTTKAEPSFTPLLSCACVYE